MADPVFGYSTLQIIPTLDGASAIMNRELSRILGRVGESAGQEAGQQIAKGIAASDSEVAAAARKLTDAASEGASQSGEAAGKKLGAGVADGMGSERASVEAAAKRLGDIAGDGVEGGLQEVDLSVGSKLDRERGEVEAAAERLGRLASEGIEDGLNGSPVNVDGAFAGLDDAGVSAGLDAGAGVGSGVAAGLAEAGTEIAGEFAELGISGGNSIGGGIASGLAESASNIQGSIVSAIGSVPTPVLAAGAAVGALFVQGVTDALAKGQIETKLEASLGIGQGEAARLGKLTGDIYAQNFGDSAEQVADSVGSVRRNFAGLGELSDKELGGISKAALTTSKVFDQDLNGAIAAASTLLRTGLVKDSDEAFDLITTGLQGSANKADDLLDTFNEYSTQFRELGLNGKEALGLIQQGVEAGARDADVAADSLKEFAIRAQDGSVSTIEGFEAIGLSATAMADAVAAGGPRAAEALDTTLDKLRNVKDPAEQAQIAVKLFGTQSEDMADALNAMDLSKAESEIGSIEGAAKDAQDAADDLESNFTVVRRKLEQAVEGIANDSLTPVRAAFEAEFTAAAFEDVLQTYLGPLGYIMPDFFQAGEESGAAFREGLASGGGIDAGRILGTDSIRNQAIWEGMESDLGRYRTSTLDAGEATVMLAAEVEELEKRVKPVGTELELAGVRADSFSAALENSTGLDDFLSSALTLSDATADLKENLGKLAEDADIGDIAYNLTDAAEGTKEALADVASFGEIAQERISQALQFSGEEGAILEAEKLRDKFIEIAGAAGLSEEQVIDLLEVMGISDFQVEAAIEVSGIDLAIAKFQLLYEIVNGQLNNEAFNNIEAFIGVTVAEEDFAKANELIAAFQRDMTDGSLDNPILIAINANPQKADETIEEYLTRLSELPPASVPFDADPTAANETVEGWRGVLGSLLTDTNIGANLEPADGEVGAWRFGVGSLFTDTNVGANTNPADSDVNLFGAGLTGKDFDVPVDADTTKAEASIRAMLERQRRFAITIGGSPSGDQTNRRASGGPVFPNEAYWVGDRYGINSPSAELFVPDRPGQVFTQQQVSDSLGAPSSKTTNINVQGAAQPVETADEIARAMRRDEWVGV